MVIKFTIKHSPINHDFSNKYINIITKQFRLIKNILLLIIMEFTNENFATQENRTEKELNEIM